MSAQKLRGSQISIGALVVAGIVFATWAWCPSRASTEPSGLARLERYQHHLATTRTAGETAPITVPAPRVPVDAVAGVGLFDQGPNQDESRAQIGMKLFLQCLPIPADSEFSPSWKVYGRALEEILAEPDGAEVIAAAIRAADAPTLATIVELLSTECQSDDCSMKSSRHPSYVLPAVIMDAIQAALAERCTDRAYAALIAGINTPTPSAEAVMTAIAFLGDREAADRLNAGCQRVRPLGDMLRMFAVWAVGEGKVPSAEDVKAAPNVVGATETLALIASEPTAPPEIISGLCLLDESYLMQSVPALIDSANPETVAGTLHGLARRYRNDRMSPEQLEQIIARQVETTLLNLNRLSDPLVANGLIDLIANLPSRAIGYDLLVRWMALETDLYRRSILEDAARALLSGNNLENIRDRARRHPFH